MDEVSRKYVLEPIGDTFDYYRVRAVRDFSDVRAGDLGGRIKHEKSLSHFGNCWIYDDCVVSGDSRVLDNAVVKNNASVLGYSIICDNAVICGSTDPYNSVSIGGYTRIQDNAKVFDGVTIYGKTIIRNNTVIKDNAQVVDCSIVGNSIISDEAIVLNSLIGNSIIRDNVHIHDYVVADNCELYGNLKIVDTDKYKHFNDLCINELPTKIGRWAPIGKKTIPKGYKILELTYDDKIIYQFTKENI